MRALSAACLLLATSSLAQPVPSADLEQVWLDPAGRGSLLVGNGSTLPRTGFRAGVSLSFAHGSMRSLSDPASTLLVEDRLGFQVFGAVGMLDWLELAVVVPVIAYQQGAESLALASGGLGNPWISLKARVTERGPLNVAVALGVGVPTGTPAAQGNGGVGLAPRVQVGRVWDDFQLAAELGVLVREPIEFARVTGSPGDVVGSQLWLSGAVSSLSASGPRGEASVRLLAPLQGGRAGLEAQVGLRWAVGPVELFASGGPGFGGEPSTPFVRVFAGAAFANVEPTLPPCVEGRPYALSACPQLDRDGDQVKNANDAAPEAPEDRDGFEDEDGVPDPDNDRDGVLDPNDRCPNDAGHAGNDGCPDRDVDADGVVDRIDSCPTVAEDVDGFEDADGCPDPDNDADSVPDPSDDCPTLPGAPERRGCPAKDSDGDSVSDDDDRCPTAAGLAEDRGCPAAMKPLVVVQGSTHQEKKVVLFDAKKSAITAKAAAVLQEVARVLKEHPELKRLRIEGHAYEGTDPTANRQLSEARANAVKAWLVKAGVAPERLEVAALGMEYPLAPPDTKEGQAANQRVEFRILEL